jgi:hypothetical protein
MPVSGILPGVDIGGWPFLSIMEALFGFVVATVSVLIGLQLTKRSRGR